MGSNYYVLNTQLLRWLNHRHCRFIIGNIRQRRILTSPVRKKQKTVIVAQKMVIVESKKWPDVQGNVTITVKQKKQLTFKPINALIDRSVSLLKNCTDTTKKDTQTACFSFVLFRFIIKVSNYTVVEFYE